MVRSRKHKAMEEEGDMDRVSNLPEVLIHKILSYLDRKEAARTSVLSKAWLQSYYTIPNLSFIESDFKPKPDICKGIDIDRDRAITIARNSFVNFVSKTLLRYKTLNLSIQKFYIESSLLDASHTSSLLGDWIRLAFHTGFQHLIISHDGALNITRFSPTPLPSTIFESPNHSLTHLTVHGCTFPQNVVISSNSKCNATIFPFLRNLKLYWCYIDDQMLQKLLSVSPSLENILFHMPSGFKKLRVCDLPQLKTIEIFNTHYKIEVYIENAPSLIIVKYVDHFSFNKFRVPFSLKVASAPNLKCLELEEVSTHDNQLRELVTKLPRLEDLKVIRCLELERINIASDSLKHLCFSLCNNIVEAKIDAPKLLKLEYKGQKLLSFSLNNTPQEFMAHILIVHNFGQPSDLQLKELLLSLNRARVTLKLYKIGITFDFGANPLPPEHQTEKFMQEMHQSSSLFMGFVNTLFSNSRPTTIVTSDSIHYVDFSKFLGRELVTTTRNSNCCGSDKIKCWRHFLKNIEVEVYDDSLKVWQTLHPKTLQSESTFPDKKKIRFTFEWYDNLNGQA